MAGGVGNNPNGPSAQLKALTAENASLKQEIGTWLAKLNEAERRNGKKVCTEDFLDILTSCF